VQHGFLSNFHKTLTNIITISRLESDVNGVVWDASLVLASYLLKCHRENPAKFKDKSIIELGAGLGCVGISTACLSGNVITTDLEKNQELLSYNVEKNMPTFSRYGTVTVKPLSWSKQSASDLLVQQHFDYILLSDCIYYEESIEPLIDTLEILCDNASVEILISQELRESKRQLKLFKEFLSKLSQIFTLKEIPYEKHNEEMRSEDIVIYSCRKNDCRTVSLR
jgi:protein N-lysine methyltransferase METTL21D